MAKEKDEISEKQYEVLRFIVQWVCEKGYQPSRAEIGAGLGLTASAISERIRQLARLGYVNLEESKERALVINDVSYQMKEPKLARR